MPLKEEFIIQPVIEPENRAVQIQGMLLVVVTIGMKPTGIIWVPSLILVIFHHFYRRHLSVFSGEAVG